MTSNWLALILHTQSTYPSSGCQLPVILCLAVCNVLSNIVDLQPPGLQRCSKADHDSLHITKIGSFEASTSRQAVSTLHFRSGRI
ncbi:hypothetical protein KC19_7G045300 [Ceratodon purpureus]|uniref:Secreted protein n=1 Tax=Ceratodon purpureus TaxID=3225 RepID=A0A8T0H4L5_CERPU|nr:hypothetical protein KC19_7G045300 [Ceratodon purpureus]